MRLLFLLLLILSLTLPVFASTAALEGSTELDASGKAQIALTLTLTLDTVPDDLRFPLPDNAEAAQVNGKSVAVKNNSVALSADVPGIYTYSIRYRIPDTLETTPDGLFVSLPLVSGFALPIDSMVFSVTLPGQIESEPTFHSAYHGDAMADRLAYTLEENRIAGSLTQGLKDHESLTMQLEVKPTLFPQHRVAREGLGLWGVGMIGFGLLALVYYILLLRPAFPKRMHSPNAPEGIEAGLCGTVLTGAGPDLTMLIFSWARLGYVSIRLEGRRITLTQRMEMGNERSDFEVQVFRRLFKNKDTVNALGRHYAELARRVAAQKPLEKEIYEKSLGKTPVFRVLAGISGAFSGVCLAISAASSEGWQIALGILFGLLFAIFSCLLQEAGKQLLLRDRLPVYLGLGGLGIWLFLGLITGNILLAGLTAAFQLVCAILAAFGGSRTEGGQRSLSQVLSLRRYLKTASPRKLKRMLIFNPDYFYELAPYALALGVDREFARRFGRAELPQSSFLETRNPPKNARDWAALLRKTAERMDEMHRKMRYRQIFRR